MNKNKERRFIMFFGLKRSPSKHFHLKFMYFCNLLERTDMQMKEETTYKPDYSSSMAGHLGILFLPTADGTVQAEMPVDHRTAQPFGMLNGGASLALAEIVAGHGSMALCRKDEYACGVQVSGNHISTVPTGGKVIATGKLIHSGSSSHIWNIDITTPEGRLVSTVRVVNFILKRK